MDLKRGEDWTLRMTATKKVANECGCSTCYSRNFPSRSCRRLKHSRDGNARRDTNRRSPDVGRRRQDSVTTIAQFKHMWAPDGAVCPGTDSTNCVDIRSDRTRCCSYSLCCLSARTIHDVCHWLKDCVVWQINFHLLVSPMMSHAHSSSSGRMVKTTSSRGHEPNVIDNFDYSEATTAIFQNESVDVDRNGTVVFVRYGTRRWAYQKSPIFTTVRSAARRISEPETNLSLSWRKFVTSSVLFHTNKYWQTLVRTKFKFVSKTEIKSRPGKRA